MLIKDRPVDFCVENILLVEGKDIQAGFYFETRSSVSDLVPLAVDCVLWNVKCPGACVAF